MATHPGPYVVKRPPAPQQPAASLLNSIPVIGYEDLHEGLGIATRDWICDLPWLWDTCNVNGVQIQPDGTTVNTMASKPVANPGQSEWCSFDVGLGRTCVTAGETFEEAVQSLETVFTAKEHLGVEHQIMSAPLDPTCRHIASAAQGTVDLTPATSTDVVGAFGLLEQFLARQGTLGIIHLTAPTAVLAARFNLLRYQSNGTILSPAGNIVVIGGGYNGQDPLGVVNPTFDYIYATGLMLIARSELFGVGQDDQQIVDRATNDREARIERSYTPFWDDCAAAGAGVDCTRI